MTEEQEYEQYLIETGQKPAAPKKPSYQAADGRIDPAALMKANFGSEQPDFAAGMENALSLGGGRAANVIQRAGQSKAAQSVMSKLPGMARGVTEDAALSAAQADGDTGDKLKAFLAGGAGSGLMRGAGALAGKVGDVAMQASVGRRKYTPGVGTTLADEGLIGTTGMLKDQVSGKMRNRYQEMGEIAESVPGTPISARRIGQEVFESDTAKMTGNKTIRPSEADLKDYHRARAFGEGIASRGDESVADALKHRAAAGERAYRSKENPSLSPVGKLSKLEQQKYSQAAKAADTSGRLADVDKSYSALARAKTGLEKEASIPTSIMGAMGTTATSVPGGSLLASAVGQAGVKGGRLAEFLAPLARQAAVGGSRDAGPSAEELDEYEQYLRETGQK